MDQLEKTLIEMKLNFEKSSLDKVHTELYIYDHSLAFNLLPCFVVTETTCEFY